MSDSILGKSSLISAPLNGVSEIGVTEKICWRLKRMKKFLLATVALVALGAPALAADLAARPYTKAPPMAAPIYNWTGFYIGGHIGAAFGNDNTFNGLVIGGNDDARFLGGVQVGADYQFAPNWVLGVEGQYSWLANNNGSLALPERLRLHQRPAWHRLGDRPHRLHLGSGTALREGRLRLLRQPRDPPARRRAGGVRLRQEPQGWLDRRCRPRIHVRPELVGQGRVPVLRLRHAPPS